MDRDVQLSRSSQLEEWFLDRGGRLHPNICIAYQDEDGHGYCLEQKETVKETATITGEPEVLIFTPANVCLSFLQIPSVAPWWPCEWIDRQTPTILTRFLLVESAHLGDRCQFSPYIQCLPRCFIDRPFNTPLYWEPEEMEFLRGTNLYFAREKRLEEWTNEFEKARSELADFCPEYQAHIEQFDKRDYIWAATVLTSRCFPGSLITSLEGDASSILENPDANLAATSIYKSWLSDRQRYSFPVLIPVLDLANHSPEADVTWEAREDGVGLKAVLPGERAAEVFNNYGQKSNEELILGYGFDLPRNPANHFGLSLPVGRSEKLRIIAKAESACADSASIPGTVCATTSNLRQDVKDANVSHLSSRIYVLREKTHPLESSAATPLAQLAMNSRELRLQCEEPYRPPLLKMRFPTRLGVVCAVQFFVYLQQKHLQIAANSENLPDAALVAESQTMQMAKRYRDSQLSISAEAMEQCGKTLSNWAKTGYLLSLDAILTGFTPPNILRNYRKTIHRVLGSRKASSIRRKGQEEVAFVLWVLNIARSLEEQSETAEDGADPQSDGPRGLVSYRQLREWMSHLAGYHGLPLVVAKQPSGKSGILNEINQACWGDEAQAEAAEAVAVYEEHLTTDQSDIDLTRDFVLTTDGETVTVSPHDMLAWAVRVVREEGTEIPMHLLGDTEDSTEYHLVFDEDLC